MRAFLRFRYFGLAAVLIGTTLHAQIPQGPFSCLASRHENKPLKKKLWDGYEVSLGPVRIPTPEGDNCTAAIYNARGRVVFRSTGFSVAFEEKLTGQDFDGDGKGEVVFSTDTGGGMHCCWAYNVVSLYPRPHRLFDLGTGGAVHFEKDKQGRMVIWERTPGPYGFTSMARQPFAEKAFRVRDGKLVDSTPEFCGRLLGPGNEDYDIERAVLTPEKLSRLSAGSEPDDDTASALLSLALQKTFCRQFDDASGLLDQWPKPGRAKVKSAFAKSIEKDYPEFATKLREALEK